MKTQTKSTQVQLPPDRKSSYSIFSSLSVLAAGLALFGGQSSAVAQTDDFNDGNDAGWTRYDPGTQLTGLGAPFNVPGVYSFPSGGYRMQGFAFPAAFGAGPTRLGSYRDQVDYSNFQVGVELVTWDNSLNQAFGLLLRANSLFLGGTEGYTATYDNSSGDLQINRVLSEAPSELGATVYLLDPASEPYRLVAEGYNSLMVARIFRSSDPNTPIMGVIASDATYANGKCGMFTYDDGPAADMTPGCDTTFDNYAATAPANYPCMVTELFPRPFSISAPFVSGLPEIKVAILDRQTTVNQATIVLTVDGTVVPLASLTITPEVLQPGNAIPFAGTTVTYTPASLPNLGGIHTCNIAFQDNLGAAQNITWTYTFRSLQAPALPVGGLSVRGFDARMVQSQAADPANNSVATAEAMLKFPPTYAVDLTTTNITQLVAWDITDPPSHYGAVTNFPGLCLPPANVNNFAVEVFTYLELTAGAHRLVVDSDDAVAVYTGANLHGTTVLISKDGVTHELADFVAPTSGLYPFRIVYQEGGGDAYLVLKSADVGNTNLVNDVGGVNAYYPVVCQSATSVAGPYAADAAANAGNVLTTAPVLCDGNGAPLNLAVPGGTLTVPLSGPAKFYRLDSPRGSKITSINKVGSNVVITYQLF